MKDHPIIMTGHSPVAILSGLKTRTRRLVKFERDERRNKIEHEMNRYPVHLVDDTGDGWIFWTSPDIHGFTSSHYKAHQGVKSPHAVGDYLWVRETWAVESLYENGDAMIEYRATPKQYQRRTPQTTVSIKKPVHGTMNYADSVWRSPMFMPRWVSRMTLRITEVNCEPLQAITEDEACRELGLPLGISHNAIDQFALRWNGLHHKRGYGWEVDPMVWVYAFEVLTLH